MIKFSQDKPLVDPVQNDLSSMNNAAVSVMMAEPKAQQAQQQQQKQQPPPASGGGSSSLTYIWKLCSWAGGKFWNKGR